MAILPALLAERTFYLVGVGPHESWWVVAGALALCAFVLGWLDRDRVHSRRPSGIMTNSFSIGAVILVAAAFQLPQTVVIGLILTTAALLFQAAASRPLMAGLARSYAGFTGLWLLIAGLSWICGIAEPRIDWGETLGPPTAWLLNGLGLEAHSEAGLLHVRSYGFHLSVLPSPDKFGGAFPILFAVSLLWLGAMARIPKRRILTAAALVVPYAMLRCAWWVGEYSQGLTEQAMWWREEWILVTFAPLIALCAIVLGARPLASSEMRERMPDREMASIKPGGKFWPLSPLLAFAGGLMLTMSWLWVDTGHVRQGAILIDERYSAWEPSEEPLDTERFGVRTVYNMWSFADALGHYFEVKRNHEPFTTETLRGVSVLILKTPTKAYPASELDVIEQFVRKGGGLWTISDHTDVFGMTTHLRPVAARFGVQLAADAVIDVEANRQICKPKPWDHPIFRRMPQYLWMTGHSLRGPWTTRDAFAADRLLCDAPDHSVNTGFGDFAPQLNERIGQVTQAVALEADHGRLAHWSDSTVFSNFAIFQPGKFELGLGYVDWLRRSNSTIPVRAMLFAAGTALLVAGAWNALRTTRNLAVVFAALWVGHAAAYPCAAAVLDRCYPALAPNQPFESAIFVERSKYPEQQPILTTFQDPMATQYLSAFIAMQRVGLRPSFADEAKLPIDAKLIVLARHGGRDLTPSDVQSLLEAARGGATVIWLDFGDAPPWVRQAFADGSPVKASPWVQSESDEVAKLRKTLGEAVAKSILPDGPVLLDADGREIGSRRLALTFEEGPACRGHLPLRDEPSRFAAIEATIGQGRLIVSGTYDAFSDVGLGNSSSVPTASQYDWLRMLFGWYAPHEHRSPSGGT